LGRSTAAFWSFVGSVAIQSKISVASEEILHADQNFEELPGV
jgi:hypothetical protein